MKVLFYNIKDFLKREQPATINKSAVLTIFLIISASLYLKGQDIKFKDIYPLIESGKSDEAFPFLKEFLKEEPDNPGANLQMAMIYEDRFHKCQPLLQFQVAMENANEAKIYYLKASLLVDEKEIKKNGKKYYTNLATRDNRGKTEVDFYRVRKKIDSAYIEIDNFIRNVPIIYGLFSEAVRDYNNANKIFMGINAKYRSPDLMLLLYSDGLKDSLEELKTEYDSSIFMIRRYLKSSENYPVTNYKQRLEIRKIIQYRIDGIETKHNFLSEEIVFWDYGSWVDEFLNSNNSDFSEFRKQILSYEDKLDKSLNLLKDPETAAGQSINLVHPDRGLIQKIRSYDNHSVIIPLLDYKEKKQNLLFNSIMTYKNTSNTVVSKNYKAILYCYSNNIRQALVCDSILQNAEGLASEENLKKYEDQIDKYYYGINGINKYFQNEHEFLKKQIVDYSERIGKILNNDFEDSQFESEPQSVIYQGRNVSIARNLPDSINIPADIYYTSQSLISPDTTVFIGGIVRPKTKKNQNVVFLAKANIYNSVDWLQTYLITPDMLDSATTANIKTQNISFFNQRSSVMTIIPNGCALVISVFDTVKQNIYNILKIVDREGNEVFSGLIKTNAVPRMMKYDEQNNSLVIIFRGNCRLNNSTEKETVFINSIDMDGKKLWDQQFDLAGDLAGFAFVKDGFLLSGNYKQLVDPKGYEYKKSDDDRQTNIFLYKFGMTGDFRDQKHIHSTNPYQLYKMIKVNDLAINLECLPGKILNGSNKSRKIMKDVINILADSDLHLINSEINLQD